MGWTAPKLWTVGEMADAAGLNQQIRDNLLQTMPALAVAKGDIFPATAANALTALAVGTDTHFLVADSAEASGMKWATIPTHSH